VKIGFKFQSLGKKFKTFRQLTPRSFRSIPTLAIIRILSEFRNFAGFCRFGSQQRLNEWR